jgi:hypothetical protein
VGSPDAPPAGHGPTRPITAEEGDDDGAVRVSAVQETGDPDLSRSRVAAATDHHHEMICAAADESRAFENTLLRKIGLVRNDQGTIEPINL